MTTLFEDSEETEMTEFGPVLVRHIKREFSLGREKSGKRWRDAELLGASFGSTEELILTFRELTNNRYPSFYTVSHCEEGHGDKDDENRSFYVACAYNPFFTGSTSLWIYGADNPLFLRRFEENFPKTKRRKILE